MTETTRMLTFSGFDADDNLILRYREPDGCFVRYGAEDEFEFYAILLSLDGDRPTTAVIGDPGDDYREQFTCPLSELSERGVPDDVTVPLPTLLQPHIENLLNPTDFSVEWADYAQMNLDWLEGRRTCLPTHHGPPAEETLPLLPALIQMTNLGLVTSCSQPGVGPDVPGTAGPQRAYVEARCTPETYFRLEAGLLGTDLVMLSTTSPESGWGFPPDLEDAWVTSVTVSLREGRPYSFLGRMYPEPEEPANAWIVQIFDPVWGRNDLLWDAVITALLL